ncbi:MAG: hypothetical protein AAGK97_00120 [Bacteroidota bacterium]
MKKYFPIALLLLLTQAMTAQFNVGINIDHPEAGLDILSPNERLIKISNINREQVFEINENGNLGFNTPASDNKETMILAPGKETLAFEEVLLITNKSRLPIFSVEEEGDIGIGTSSPKAQLHISGGSGDILATHGDLIIGETTNGLRFGINKSGSNAGTAMIHNVGLGSNIIEIGAMGKKDFIIDSKNKRYGFGNDPTVFFDLQNEEDAMMRLRSENDVASVAIDGADSSQIIFGQKGLYRSGITYKRRGVDQLSFNNIGIPLIKLRSTEILFPQLSAANTTTGLDKEALIINEFGYVSSEPIITKETYCISAASFHTRSDETIYLLGGDVSFIPSVSNNIYTPINIPHGKIIRRIKLYYLDNSNIDFKFSIELQALNGPYGTINLHTTSENEFAIKTVTKDVFLEFDYSEKIYFLKIEAINGNTWELGDIRIRAIIFSEDPNF